MKLRLKIIMLLTVAAVLPLIAVFISMTIYANRQRDSLVNMKLNNVYSGAVGSYERIGQSILSQMEHLATDQTLTRYLLVKDDAGYIDQQGLIDFVSRMQQLLNLDYLVLVGPDGKVLARGHDPGFFGDNISSDPFFADALKGQKAQSLSKTKIGGSDVLTVLAATPVWFENSEMIASIVGGRTINEDFCRNLKDLSGAEILLVEDNTLIAKTLAGRVDELMLYLQKSDNYRTQVQGFWYTFAKYPLKDFSGNEIAELLMGVSTYDLDMSFNNIRIIYGSLAFGGLLMAIILGIVFTSGITRPVEELTRAADRLAVNDFSARVSYESGGELGNLIDTFNSMAEDLESNRRKMVESERLQAFTQMARKVAHEIKNPLTPIRIAIEDLRRAEAASDPNFKESFDRSTKTVLEEVTALTRIVDEFSEFARFPSPQMKPEDLNDIVLAATALFPMEISQGIVKTELTQKQIPVLADKDQIKRAIMNLIKNAVEAIPETGRIIVKTTLSETKALVVIKDNGPGLSSQAKQNLFNPYFTTKPRGSGLGLVIVKKIIGEHDGSIMIADSADGGAEAAISLPLRRL